MEDRVYFCIDMKTFYASVECAERNLNPFETDLVVADVTRGKNALCLAVSPHLKAQGIKNRCRISDIPRDIKYIAAPPAMQRYIDYAADIYGIYLDYFAPEDIHVYSIDESFIDATEYLRMYRTDPKSLATALMNEIANLLRIPSTAGIGTNLYLAKIALDITAKRARDHIGMLNEVSYRDTLWDHLPITDFWQISIGIARRLERYGIYTMRQIAHAPEELLYHAFGINAELLIDHAYGRECCRIKDIKNYDTKSRSVSFSQILPRNYGYEEAKTVLKEMVIHGCLELSRRHLITRKVWIGITYSCEALESSKGSFTLPSATSSDSVILPAAERLFNKIALQTQSVRRLGISFPDVVDENCEGYDLFANWAEIQRNRNRNRAVLEIGTRFGKNAMLRGTNLLDCATQRERNCMIGGHRAGYDDPSGKSETIHAV